MTEKFIKLSAEKNTAEVLEIPAVEDKELDFCGLTDEQVSEIMEHVRRFGIFFGIDEAGTPSTARRSPSLKREAKGDENNGST